MGARDRCRPLLMKPSIPVRAYHRILRPFRRFVRDREVARATRDLAAMRLESPVVVILMSGGLHVARLARARIPAGRPVLLVFNGLDRWESAWGRLNLAADGYLGFTTTLRHSEIINLLVDHLPTNFYLLDYDCFVLNDAWFARLGPLDERTMLSGCFPYTVAGTEVELAHTFLLYINRGLLCRLKARFGIGAEEATWETLPEAARIGIRKSGLADGIYPEPDRPYFDTLRALLLAGIGDGMKCAIVGRLPAHPVPNTEMVHVGGVSPRGHIFNFWLFRGAYFWRKALQHLADAELGRHYRAKFGNADPAALAAEFPGFASEMGKDLDALFDEIIRTSPCLPGNRTPPSVPGESPDTRERT